MKKLYILTILILTSCASNKKEFLDHLYSRTPEPYKECLTNYVKNHWKEIWENYSDKDRGASRGEIDDLDYVIYRYVDKCRK